MSDVRDPMNFNVPEDNEDYSNTAIIDLDLTKPLIKQLLDYLSNNNMSLKWFINAKDKYGTVSGYGIKKQIIAMIYREMINGLQTDTKTNRNNYLLYAGRKYYFPGSIKFTSEDIDEKFAYLLGHLICIEKAPIPFPFTPCLLLPYLESIPKQNRIVDLDNPNHLIEFYRIGYPDHYKSLKNIKDDNLTFEKLDEMFGYDFKNKAMEDIFNTNNLINSIATHFSLFLGQLEFTSVNDLINQIYSFNVIPDDRLKCFILGDESFIQIFNDFITQLSDSEFKNLIQHSTGSEHTTEFIKVKLVPIQQDICFNTCQRAIGICDKITTKSDLIERIQPLLSSHDFNMIDVRRN